MKYMLLMSVDKSVTLDPDQRTGIPAAVGAWVEEMDARGVRLQGHVLAPASDAKTVRIRDGRVDIRDDAVLDEALEVASKHPLATFGVLEIRPFVEH